MRRGAKPANAKIDSKRPVAPKSRKEGDARVRDLEKRLADSLDQERAAGELLREKDRALAEAREQQRATSEILQVISASPAGLQAAFNAILRRAVRLCEALFGVIYRFDGELIHVVAHHNFTPDALAVLRSQFPSPPGPASVTSRAILERTVVAVEDGSDETTLAPGFVAVARRLGYRGIVSVPMLREGAPIGTITMASRERGLLTDTQIDLLKTFADQAAIAIENARLFTELQEKNSALTQAHAQVKEALEQQTATTEILRVISSSPTDTQPVFDAIASRVVRLCDAYFSTVWRYDGTLIHHAADNYPTRQMREILTMGYPAPARRGSAVAEAIDEGRIVHVEDLLDSAAPAASREVAIALGYRTLLCVPMLRDGVSIGAIAVARREQQPFGDRQIELVKTFASQAVIAIENVRLFNELQARNREVEAQSRELEAASRHKSEFLANMSHELRTPLNAILGFSEVLGERMFGELNDKQDEYLRDIHTSGQHLLSLINDILDLSKIEAGRMELALSEFSLAATLENALTLVRERAARHGVAVRGTIDARVGQVRADERKIRQVVLNLLSNAIKFTPEGGRIDVSAVPGDGVVEVSVSDTGVGIAPEDQGAIFEEFRQVGTADKKVEGTGLGLALSRKFVELHGGRIWVQSQVGTGSRFTFTIPAWREEKAPAAPG